MKKIDIRLNQNEMSLLRSMVGQEFSAFLHDEFQYTQSSSQAVELVISGTPYYIYSFTEEQDYFGSTEDVAVLSLSSEKLPIIDKKSFINTPVKKVINDIILIQENQRVYEKNNQIYDVWLTRGIVFIFDDRQIAFEKDIWFSEEIIIHRGYDLAKYFSSPDHFGDDWDNKYKTECIRIDEHIIHKQ